MQVLQQSGPGAFQLVLTVCVGGVWTGWACGFESLQCVIRCLA